MAVAEVRVSEPTPAARTLKRATSESSETAVGRQKVTIAMNTDFVIGLSRTASPTTAAHRSEDVYGIEPNVTPRTLWGVPYAGGSYAER